MIVLVSVSATLDFVCRRTRSATMDAQRIWTLTRMEDAYQALIVLGIAAKLASHIAKALLTLLEYMPSEKRPSHVAKCTLATSI
mmetsp:Transcript_9907/g.17827  ORF Transcript_9907/g.17827 Transcript_9907/m.17827 type:complete len:84 (-) Transcript_9907:1014-1265(-)